MSSFFGAVEIFFMQGWFSPLEKLVRTPMRSTGPAG